MVIYFISIAIFVYIKKKSNYILIIKILKDTKELIFNLAKIKIFGSFLKIFISK